MSAVAPPSSPTSDAQAVTLDWPALAAGLAAVAAGLFLHADGAANEALFHVVNDLGPRAPALWSTLSVAGLALSAWIYLAAFARDVPGRAAQLLWVVVVGGLTASFIKHHVDSPRPFLALGADHVNVVGEILRVGSMPSGHSAMAFALLALLRGEKRRFDEHGAVGGWITTGSGQAAAVLLAFGIALSRLAVGAHWPADACVGGGLGLVFGSLAPHAWPVGAMTRLLSRPTGQRLMAAGMLASAFSIAATPGLLDATGLVAHKWARNLQTGYPLAAPLQLVLALVALAGAWRWWRAGTRAR